MIEASRETWSGEDDLGIRLCLSGDVDVGRVAEECARANSSRAPHVWVWVWAEGMDLFGPAACISYASGGEVLTEFTPGWGD